MICFFGGMFELRDIARSVYCKFKKVALNKGGKAVSYLKKELAPIRLGRDVSGI